MVFRNKMIYKTHAVFYLVQVKLGRVKNRKTTVIFQKSGGGFEQSIEITANLSENFNGKYVVKKFLKYVGAIGFMPHHCNTDVLLLQ